jgi:hypothetical protein
VITLTETSIKQSFINSSLKERQNLTLPKLDELRWDRLDYLGWRDRRIPSLGYVVVELDGQSTGIVVREADTKPRSRSQCSWCEDIHLPNDVVIFGAKRTGAAGRNGNTVATLVCSNFECSTNVRRLPPVAYVGFDVEAARQARIEALRMHVRDFVRDIRASGG